MYNQSLPSSLGPGCTLHSVYVRLQQTSELFFLVGCGRGESFEPQHQGLSMETRPSLSAASDMPPHFNQVITQSGPVPMGDLLNRSPDDKTFLLQIGQAERLLERGPSPVPGRKEYGHSGHIVSCVCALCYAIDGPAAVGSGLPVRLLALPACLPACPACLPGWLYITQPRRIILTFMIAFARLN